MTGHLRTFSRVIGFLSFALLTNAAVVHAATIYRCGSVYSQTPCPAGTTLEVNDARTAAQRADAADVAARERRLGNRLQHERVVLEAAPAARAGRLDADSPVATRPRPRNLKGWPVPKKKKAAKATAKAA